MEQILITILTTALGYIVGYRKNKADIEGTQLDNLEKSIKIYQVIIDDLSKKVDELTMHVVRLEATIDSLKKENNQLRSKKIIKE
jgi:FtsZ-binding cell division protein ZapB